MKKLITIILFLVLLFTSYFVYQKYFDNKEIKCQKAGGTWKSPNLCLNVDNNTCKKLGGLQSCATHCISPGFCTDTCYLTCSLQTPLFKVYSLIPETVSVIVHFKEKLSLSPLF